MWGELWNQMIWGGGAAVPLFSTWGIVALLMASVLGGIWFHDQERRAWAIRLGIGLVLMAPVVGYAVPHLFVNGTVADADEVNNNFADLEARIAALETGAVGYDSGMVAVGTNQNVDFVHGLGTTSLVVSLYFSPVNATDGRHYGPAPLSWREHNPERVAGVTIESVTTTTLRLRTGFDFRVPSNSPGADAYDLYTTGFVRVVAVPVQ